MWGGAYSQQVQREYFSGAVVSFFTSWVKLGSRFTCIGKLNSWFGMFDGNTFQFSPNWSLRVFHECWKCCWLNTHVLKYIGKCMHSNPVDQEESSLSVYEYTVFSLVFWVFFFSFLIFLHLKNSFWIGCFGLVELVWLSRHRSRSSSISKYLPSYWLSLFLASESAGLLQLKSSWFVQYWNFLIDWVRLHMFPRRICWEAAEEESQRRINWFCSWQKLF